LSYRGCCLCNPIWRSAATPNSPCRSRALPSADSGLRGNVLRWRIIHLPAAKCPAVQCRETFPDAALMISAAAGRLIRPAGSSLPAPR